jgi:hypothetical protein
MDHVCPNCGRDRGTYWLTIEQKVYCSGCKHKWDLEGWVRYEDRDKVEEL